MEDDDFLKKFLQNPIESTNTILRGFEKKNSDERMQNFIRKKFYHYYM